MTHGKTGIRLMALVIVAALFLPLFTSALAASYPYDAVSLDDVNLRSRANTTSTILKKIKAGDTVSILGVSGSYYRVRFDGETGYAMKKFIDGTDSSPDPTPDPSITMQAPPAVTDYPYDTVTIGNVKLRKSAKEDADVYRTLLADSVVTVYNLTDNGFARVKHEGRTGYVLASYLVLADIPTPTPVPTATPKPGSENYTELSKGSSGTAVTALQSALAELGYLTATIDGKYGTQTEAAVLAFQKRNGLTQNGIASAELQLLMYEGTPKDTRGYRQYVKTVAPVAGATIKEKSTGEAVSRMQTRLKELGYYTGEITGTCDKDTVTAIEAFEAQHSLTQDGVLDFSDQSVLYGATAMGAWVVVTPTPAPTLAPPTTTVRRGDKGADATTVQQRLKDLGYYTGRVTGTFNSASEEALKEFQTKTGLEADGVCGPATRTALFGTSAIYAVATAIPVVAESATTAPITEDNVVIIKSGSMGAAVLDLQRRLQALGYYTSRLDGVYLTEDIEAVRAFQSANGLKVDGKAGYQTQSLLYSDTAVRGNAVVTGTTATMRYGSTGAEVTTLQNKLIELGYLTGTADGNFGMATKSALMAFQKANGLTRDGVAGSQTLAALNATTAVSNTVSASSSLKIGATSDAVRDLQNRLITLGYLTGRADGKFGLQTNLAVMAFQKANGLTADGIAGTSTIKKLNSTSAVTASGTGSTTTTATAPSVSGVSAANVRYANWYTEVKARCRLYPNATIYDFTTGISWQVNMFSLGAHADAEPITAADTANMNRAFGKTTWTPKAVWVVFSDGRVYMASTHNTPHDTYHIRDNNFNGHVCIHFPRTQAQVEAIGSYATSHQKAIDLGWAATLRRAGQ